MAAIFRFYRFRFHFRALEALRFPAGKAGNTIRGALGLALRSSDAYASLFRPSVAAGFWPSGLTEPPRPFVLRAGHLDGVHRAAGDTFWFDAHTFDPVDSRLGPLREAFERLAAEGIGPGRGRAALERIEQFDLQDAGRPVTDAPIAPPLAVELEDAPRGAVESVRLLFVSPTSLKREGGVLDRPEFAVLFARLRDRIGALAEFYGGGRLAVDFRGPGERAAAVRLTHANLTWHHGVRRSARTGQVHPLGGFTGEAAYAGDLGEFIPWLAAARWVGIGRHTVWGHGDVRVDLLPLG